MVKWAPYGHQILSNEALISEYIEISTNRQLKSLALTPMEWDILWQMIGVRSAPHWVSLKVSLIHALLVHLIICFVLYSGLGITASCMMKILYLVVVMIHRV